MYFRGGVVCGGFCWGFRLCLCPHTWKCPRKLRPGSAVLGVARSQSERCTQGGVGGGVSSFPTLFAAIFRRSSASCRAAIFVVAPVRTSLVSHSDAWFKLTEPIRDASELTARGWTPRNTSEYCARAAPWSQSCTGSQTHSGVLVFSHPFFLAPLKGRASCTGLPSW